MEWKTKLIDLGTLKQKVPTEIIFQATEVDKEIRNLDASCGCSVPTWDAINKQIKVQYTPGALPKHLELEQKTNYKSSKMIMVYYTDDTSDILEFTATIEK